MNKGHIAVKHHEGQSGTVACMLCICQEGSYWIVTNVSCHVRQFSCWDSMLWYQLMVTLQECPLKTESVVPQCWLRNGCVMHILELSHDMMEVHYWDTSNCLECVWGCRLCNKQSILTDDPPMILNPRLPLFRLNVKDKGCFSIFSSWKWMKINALISMSTLFSCWVGSGIMLTECRKLMMNTHCAGLPISRAGRSSVVHCGRTILTMEHATQGHPVRDRATFKPPVWPHLQPSMTPAELLIKTPVWGALGLWVWHKCQRFIGF